MANQGYTPRNKVDYDAVVNDQGKTVRDEINESMAFGKQEKVNYTRKVREAMQGEVKDEMLNYILSIDKSAYGEIINNMTVSKNILTSFQNDSVFVGLESEDQVRRFEAIYSDHLNIKSRRNQIAAKEQGGEVLTSEEKAFLTQKTPFETYIDRATENYFTEKVVLVETLISQVRDNVLYSDTCRPEDKVVASLAARLSGYGPKGETGMGFRFHKKDVSPIFNDKDALETYVHTLFKIRNTYRTPTSKVAEYQSAANARFNTGDDWKSGARSYQNMTEIEAEEFFGRPADQISQYEYDLENYKRFDQTREEQKANYEAALANYYKIEKYVIAHPEVYDFMLSPEYRQMMQLEYRETKPFDTVPPKEREAHILNMYEGRSIYRIPDEHKDIYLAARNKMALKEIDGVNARLKQIEEKMGPYWKKNANSPETNIQKQELKENRAIIKALGDYLKNPTSANQQKYFNEINKAYDNAKQRYVENPALRRRMENRSLQLGSGDFSFVPMEDARTSRDLGVADPMDTRVYTESEVSQNILKTKPFIVQAYAQYARPVWREAIDEILKKERQNSREYTLSEMASGLKGKELQEYKESILSGRMEQLGDMKDDFAVKSSELKEQKDALNKKYGLFGRLFNGEYKKSAKEIDQKLEGLKKTYKSELDKAKYDVLKTYQEKGLKMTGSEISELKSLTKNATKTGDLQKWDQERAEEKRKVEEYNKTPDEVVEKSQKTEQIEATTIQLDLGAYIRNKTVEQPVKEEAKVQNTLEKEQKVQEGPEL